METLGITACPNYREIIEKENFMLIFFIEQPWFWKRILLHSSRKKKKILVQQYRYSTEGKLDYGFCQDPTRNAITRPIGYVKVQLLCWRFSTNLFATIFLLLFANFFIFLCNYRDQAQRVNFSGAPSISDSSKTVFILLIMALIGHSLR